MNVNMAMSLSGSVRPVLQSLELVEDKSIDPAQVAFVPTSELSCEDCNPVWENGVAA